MTGYTEFSSDVTEQSGNYLAVKLSASPIDTINVSIGERGPVDVTSDGYLVVRLTETTEPLEVTVSDGINTATKEFDLTGLTLAEEE